MADGKSRTMGPRTKNGPGTKNGPRTKNQAPRTKLALTNIESASVIRSRPVEPDMLARIALPFPLEAEGVRLIGGRFSVSGDAAGTGFSAARVMHLHSLAGRGRRAAD